MTVRKDSLPWVMLGALVRRARPGDEDIAKRVRKAGVAGIALVVAWEAWGFAKDSVASERRSHSDNVATVVSAIASQAEALDRTTEAIHGLTRQIAEERASQETFRQAFFIRERQRIPLPKPVSPRPVHQEKAP